MTTCKPHWADGMIYAEVYGSQVIWCELMRIELRECSMSIKTGDSIEVHYDPIEDFERIPT